MSLRKLNITKPFEDFKWRWMEFDPVESFNRADIFMGITRALKNSEGRRASSPFFNRRVAVVQQDLLSGSKINLVPDDLQRNVIRRQGRYWRGLGVLDRVDQNIYLTQMGSNLATGVMTTDEFAVDRVFNHTLPNPYIESPQTLAAWKRARIAIKPLKLILDILNEMESMVQSSEAYITPDELVKVIIPMSIMISKISIADFARGILEYRKDPNCVAHFPNCVPRSNDKRMAREHLLFLESFDVLDSDEIPGARTQATREKYSLGLIGKALYASTKTRGRPRTPAASRTAASRVPQNFDLGAVRAKRLTEVMTRPHQAQFRRLILRNFASTCILSNETCPDVLDACHIISVNQGGRDNIRNGLCMRTDIHRLFDNGKIRIAENGSVTLSPDIQNAISYRRLPKKIRLPGNIDRDLLRRKWSYGRTWI